MKGQLLHDLPGRDFEEALVANRAEVFLILEVHLANVAVQPVGLRFKVVILSMYNFTDTKVLPAQLTCTAAGKSSRTGRTDTSPARRPTREDSARSTSGPAAPPRSCAPAPGSRGRASFSSSSSPQSAFLMWTRN